MTTSPCASPSSRAVALACVLGLLEVARSYVLTGFPWALSAYAWIETPVAQTLALLTMPVVLSVGILRGGGGCHHESQRQRLHQTKPINSRPISMRRISLVPAPISISLASRNRRLTVLSFRKPAPPSACTA